MSGTESGAPVFSCRRLLRPDLGRLCGLYHRALAPIAVPDCTLVQSWFEAGLCFGAFCGGTLVGALHLLPYRARLSPAKELRATHCIVPTYPEDSWLATGLAIEPGMPAAALAEGLLHFCGAVLERGGPDPTLLAAIPVKTATDALGVFLASGLRLCAIRPLQNLTPCYLLGPGRDDGVGESLILPLAGTLELSRALEDGWQGREVKKTSVLLTR